MVSMAALSRGWSRSAEAYYLPRRRVKRGRSACARREVPLRARERHACDDIIAREQSNNHGVYPRNGTKMKLIAAPASPYSRKVRIVLAEKRIDYEMIVDSPLDPATRVPEFNPLGKIPVLVLDDDTTLFDSRVIVEYLDNASPVGRLIPDDTRQRIQVRRWEALADGCTDAAIAVVMEKRRPAGQQSAEWIARQAGKNRPRVESDVRRAGRPRMVHRGRLQPVRRRGRLRARAISSCACRTSTGASSIRISASCSTSCRSARRSRIRRRRRARTSA